MGHIINPISFRLYYTRYWNNNWNLNYNNINYSYINIYDYLLHILLKKFFNLYLNSIKYGIIFLNIKIIRLFKNVIYNIYIHDSFYDMLVFKLFKNIKKLTFPKYKYSKMKIFFLYKIKFFLNKLIKKINRNKSKIKNIIFNYNNKKYFNILYKRSLIKYYSLTYLKRKKLRIYYHYKIFLKFFLLFLFKKFNKKFWNYIKLLLNKFINYLINFNSINYFYYFNILSVSKYQILTKIVSDYIAIRLNQNFKIGEILFSINRFFYKLYKKYKLIKGYKIQCAGRFSRKQRASFQWKIFFSLKPSTIKSRLDYSLSEIVLKFGKCAIKVWIQKNRSFHNKLLYKF